MQNFIVGLLMIFFWMSTWELTSYIVNDFFTTHERKKAAYLAIMTISAMLLILLDATFW